jgi:hypothetical protein
MARGSIHGARALAFKVRDARCVLIDRSGDIRYTHEGAGPSRRRARREIGVLLEERQP